MMKRVALLIGLLHIAFAGKASTDFNDSTSRFMSSDWGVKISGYVNPHLWVDTRQTVGGRDGQLLLYPRQPLLDAEGKDINDNSSFNMLGITSRFGLSFSTPSVLNADVNGYLEADFSGSVDIANNSFRLRHAYIQMAWTGSSLLFGQHWHPLVVPEMMPNVAPLNTGAPFHPYTRQMQMRYTVQWNTVQVFAAATTQRDNVSDGPDGLSAKYMSNAMIPNLHIQMQYKEGNFFAGIAGDMKTLKPRLSTNFGDTLLLKTNTKLYSYTAAAFAKYNFSQWDIKFQTLWAQNQSDNLMIGGYAEIPDRLKREYRYVNSNVFSSWTNISKTKGKWRPGIFFGYAKNLGFTEEITPDAEKYGRGLENIDYLWRIQPRLVYHASERLNIYTDVEHTVAAYGDPNAKGIIKSSSSIGNTRFMFGAVFLF